jgi:xylitol oxidase
MTETNWAGNHTYGADTIHRPATLVELRRVVTSASQLRALGTRHTFNDVGEAKSLVSLAGFEPEMEFDHDAMTASVNPAVRYGEFATGLHKAGLALHNMGSLPHISVGGATATGTHGSGDRNRNLSSAVCGIELMTSDGEIVWVKRGDPGFEGMVVHIGALGVVTRLTFDVQQTYDVYQEVFEGLSWEALNGHFDEVTSSGYSVSIFTMFGDDAGVLWRKHRLEAGQEPGESESWGATPSVADRHPVGELSGDACTVQMRVPGPWCERLPHFLLDRTPASGEEIQSEYFVDRAHAVDAIEALRAFKPEMADIFMIGEIRTVAQDDLWLSMAYGRETVAFHFSWFMNPARLAELQPRLDSLFAEFGARPHWGKTAAYGGEYLERVYPKYGEFRELRRRLDPRGAFVTPFLERVGLA